MNLIGKVNATPNADIVQEARHIVDAADKQGIVLRLFGGMAVRIHCPSATNRNLQRRYADVDVMGRSKQSRQIKRFFVELGYVSREVFNALQGDIRLIFNDLENERRVDIFLDVFQMCHRFEFGDRLLIDNPTISLADLLATKLQVVNATEKEYKDIIAIVHDHELSDSDEPERINSKYLAKLSSNNWGVYKTFQNSIDNVISSLKGFPLESEIGEDVAKKLRTLSDEIERYPKTVQWKWRARVGDKVRWYELPETDKEVVDSRMTGRETNST